MKLISIETKNGLQIELGTFTLLVGPNNVGKSQTLKDIHEKLVKGHDAATKLISKIVVERPSCFEELYDDLDVKKDDVNIDHSIINGVTSNIAGNQEVRLPLEQYKNQFDQNLTLDFTFLLLSKFRVFYMDSESRLNIASEVSNYIPDEQSPANLIQALYGSCEKFDEILRVAFQDAFNMNIRLDYSSGLKLRLAVAKKFKRIPIDPRKAFPVMKAYESIEIQGDGFRSFVAVVLSLLLSKDKVVLLDEPEAFLHPEQARRLGKWMSDHIDSFPCQVIVATHNSNFLSGLLSGKQSTDIYRLNRTDDITRFSKITAEATQALSSSPILSSQRVLEGIFSRGVVVCEADSDRVLYNAVAVHECNNQEVLFLHAHNKQMVKDVVSLLKGASIPTVAIIDIDILNSKSDMENIILAFCENAKIYLYERRRSKIVKYIDKKSEQELLQKFKDQVLEFSEELQNDKHYYAGAKGAWGRIKKSFSKWSEIKREGINYLPDTQKKAGKEVLKMCADLGLYIVPVGELESWIKLDVKKNKWIIPALDHIQKGNCPKELKDFVSKVIDGIS